MLIVISYLPAEQSREELIVNEVGYLQYKRSPLLSNAFFDSNCLRPLRILKKYYPDEC